MTNHLAPWTNPHRIGSAVYQRFGIESHRGKNKNIVSYNAVVLKDQMLIEIVFNTARYPSGSSLVDTCMAVICLRQYIFIIFLPMKPCFLYVTIILCEKQVIIVFKKIDDNIVIIDKLLLNSHNLRFLITMLRRRWDSNQKVIVTLATED